MYCSLPYLTIKNIEWYKQRTHFRVIRTIRNMFLRQSVPLDASKYSTYRVLIKTFPSVPSSTCQQIDNRLKVFIVCGIGKFIGNMSSHFNFRWDRAILKHTLLVNLSAFSVRTSLRFHVLPNRQGRRDWVQAPVIFFIPLSAIETKQTASYARWRLTAIAAKTTDYHLITPDTIEKDKNMYNTFGPWSPIIWTHFPHRLWQ